MDYHIINPFSKQNDFNKCWIEDEEGKGYFLIKSIVIDLHDNLLNFENSKEFPEFRIINGLLYCELSLWWNGANGAIDSLTNMLSSFTHDIGCNILNFCMDNNIVPPFTADYNNTLYASISICNGMNVDRACIHFKATKVHWNKKIFFNWINPSKWAIFKRHK